jgi:hypothetical protein
MTAAQGTHSAPHDYMTPHPGMLHKNLQMMNLHKTATAAYALLGKKTLEPLTYRLIRTPYPDPFFN